MVGDPLEGGVGEGEVVVRIAGGCGPLHDIGGDPVPIGMRRSSFGDHIGGVVEAGDLGVGPALGEDFGAVAGTAPEVDDTAGCGKFDAGGEVAAGTGALFGE